MARDTPTFKRLILGLQHGARDPSMQLAVELADLLQAELVGLFLEDPGLQDLAALPFAREFRPLSGSWHPFDVKQLSQTLSVAASSSERMFTEAASRLSTKCRFEIVRGSAMSTIQAISQVDDIVLVMAPASAAERATQQFSLLIEAAFGSAGAVMFVPPHIVRRSGSVVAIALTASDPSIAAASAVALAAKEELVIVGVPGEAAPAHSASQAAAPPGLVVRYIERGHTLASPALAAQALHDLRERLIVVSQDSVSNEAAMAVAAHRQVPVLVVKRSSE